LYLIRFLLFSCFLIYPRPFLDLFVAEQIYEKLKAAGCKPYLDTKFYFISRSEAFETSALFVPILSAPGLLSLRASLKPPPTLLTRLGSAANDITIAPQGPAGSAAATILLEFEVALAKAVFVPSSSTRDTRELFH